MPANESVFELRLSQVIRNLGLYPRTYVAESTVRTLEDAIQAGSELPPVLVNQKNWLIDGLHRWTAHDRLGKPVIKARRIITEDDADFFRRAIEANAEHGRPFGAADHSRVITKAEELGLGANEIAKALHVPPLRIDDLRKARLVTNDGDEDVLLRVGAPTAPKNGKGWRPANDGSTITSSKLTYYATQIAEAVEASLIDWEDRKLERALGRVLSCLQDTPALKEVTW